MSNILDTLNIGWVGVLIGVLSSILGIAIGHHLQKKSEKKIRPSYLINDIHVIGIAENKLPPEIKITFKDTEIRRLTKSKIIFWNDGRQTIDSTHLLQHSPIEILLERDTKIFSCQIISINNKAIKLEITKKSELPILSVNFSHLDHLDGAIIEIIHDGEYGPLMRDSLKECKEGFKFQGFIHEEFNDSEPKYWFTHPKLNGRLVPMLNIAIGVGLLGMGFLPEDTIQSLNDPQWIKSNRSIILFATGFIMSALGILSLQQRNKKRYPKALRQGLKTFTEKTNKTPA